MSEQNCHSNSCTNTAEFDVFWPGSEPVAMCQPCRDHALNIASAMGFYLHTVPLPAPPIGTRE